MCLFFVLVSCKHNQSLTRTEETKHSSSPEKKDQNALKQKYASQLGVSVSDLKNEKLYQFINDWYGVPYKYAGKDKSGIDCSGLTSTLYLNVYQKKISPSTKVLLSETKRIKDSEKREGDLVFFNIGSDKPTHVGVYLQNNKFLHASSKKGVMISDLNEPYFKKYYMCVARVQ